MEPNAGNLPAATSNWCHFIEAGVARNSRTDDPTTRERLGKGDNGLVGLGQRSKVSVTLVTEKNRGGWGSAGNNPSRPTLRRSARQDKDCRDSYNVIIALNPVNKKARPGAKTRSSYSLDAAPIDDATQRIR